MKSFYEKHRDDYDALAVQRNKNNTYPAHFHNSLEIFLVKHGRYEVQLNDSRYEVTDGSVLVVDSFDIHSYNALEKHAVRDTCVLIIPYKYLNRFWATRKDRRIANALICDTAFCARLMRFSDEFLCDGQSEAVERAAVELFLAMLAERLEFVESRSGDDRVLMRHILIYIQENYRQNLTRASIARALGYTEAHISRVFHRYLQIGISEYINNLRLAYIARLRADGDKRPTGELIFEAGFGSQQTYYRAKARSGKE